MEAANLLIKPSEGLSDKLEELLSNGSLPHTRKSFASGSFVFHEGEAIGDTYYINRGLVRLYSETADGYSKTLFYYKSRTLVGLQSLRDDHSSILTAQALTPCDTFMIKGSDLNKLLISDTGICFDLAKHLFEMMALLAREAVNASLFSVQQRLAALLLVLAEEHGGVEPVHIPYNNQMLAHMLGVHRNSVVNALRTLRDSSCVEKTQTGLIIVHGEYLQNIAQGMTAKSA
jgi:CRP-like cAMP-binding protein